MAQLIFIIGKLFVFPMDIYVVVSLIKLEKIFDMSIKLIFFFFVHCTIDRCKAEEDENESCSVGRSVCLSDR